MVIGVSASCASWTMVVGACRPGGSEGMNACSTPGRCSHAPARAGGWRPRWRCARSRAGRRPAGPGARAVAVDDNRSRGPGGRRSRSWRPRALPPAEGGASEVFRPAPRRVWSPVDASSPVVGVSAASSSASGKRCSWTDLNTAPRREDVLSGAVRGKISGFAGAMAAEQRPFGATLPSGKTLKAMGEGRRRGWPRRSRGPPRGGSRGGRPRRWPCASAAARGWRSTVRRSAARGHRSRSTVQRWERMTACTSCCTSQGLRRFCKLHQARDDVPPGADAAEVVGLFAAASVPSLRRSAVAGTG